MIGEVCGGVSLRGLADKRDGSHWRRSKSLRCRLWSLLVLYTLDSMNGRST